MTKVEEEYKEKQILRMAIYQVGSKDHIGNTITKIFSKGDEYVVYEIKTNDLSDSIKTRVDTIIEDDDEPAHRFSKVREKFTKLKGLLYKVIDDTSIKNRIGHILSHAITTDHEEANIQFDLLIDEIEKEYKNQYKHRIKYLVTTVVFLALQIILSIIVYSNNLFQELIHFRHLIYIATAASIGGFISITRRVKQMIFEKDVPPLMYIFYSLERMMITLIAGVVIYFAIQSDLIFGIVENLDKPIYGYIVFGAVAGFSETLIPNLLINLDSKED